MKIFDSYISDVKHLLATDELRPSSMSYSFDKGLSWPRGRPGSIVMSADTAIELGHPQTESMAFLMWTDSPDRIKDGVTTVVGPELDMLAAGKAPLGKITLLGVHDFTEENAYDRFLEMDLIRTRLSLEGYMLRAVPQMNREWSRISREALNKGFSLNILGNELIREYRKLPYVDAVEVIFITSSVKDIQKFRPTGDKVSQITNAMNKIFENIELDCASCDFSDVCNEVEGLRAMHKRAREKR